MSDQVAADLRAAAGEIERAWPEVIAALRAAADRAEATDV